MRATEKSLEKLKAMSLVGITSINTRKAGIKHTTQVKAYVKVHPRLRMGTIEDTIEVKPTKDLDEVFEALPQEVTAQ